MSTQPPLPYKAAAGIESASQHGVYGVRIEIHHSAFEYDCHDEAHSKLHDALYLAQETISQEMEALAIAADPRSAERTEANRQSLLGSFPAGAVIYAEPVPNEYCSRACCRHLPWYRVTGPFGVIKLGWRKRVAELDWSESAFKVNSYNLFALEDTTKGEHSIHAWSTEKIKEYLATLFNRSAPTIFPPYVPPPTIAPAATGV